LGIIISAEEFRTTRRKTVHNLLVPLRHKNMKLFCVFVPTFGRDRSLVIAARGSSYYGESFRDWTFRTFAENLRCQYFEQWKPITADQQKWSLERAYLNLFIIKGPANHREEFVCVHCDPNCDDEGYRRGIHLHIKKADSPLPKCHFPLNLSFVDKTLSSVGSITECINDAIQMIRAEVITRCSN